MATRILDAKDESLDALNFWGFPNSRERGKLMRSSTEYDGLRASQAKKESRLQKIWWEAPSSGSSANAIAKNPQKYVLPRCTQIYPTSLV